MVAQRPCQGWVILHYIVYKHAGPTGPSAPSSRGASASVRATSAAPLIDVIVPGSGPVTAIIALE